MEDCSTDEQLQLEMLCRRQWTDEYVKCPETLIRQELVYVCDVILIYNIDSFRHFKVYLKQSTTYSVVA